MPSKVSLTMLIGNALGIYTADFWLALLQKLLSGFFQRFLWFSGITPRISIGKLSGIRCEIPPEIIDTIAPGISTGILIGIPPENCTRIPSDISLRISS